MAEAIAPQLTTQILGNVNRLHSLDYDVALCNVLKKPSAFGNVLLPG